MMLLRGLGIIVINNHPSYGSIGSRSGLDVTFLRRLGIEEALRKRTAKLRLHVIPCSAAHVSASCSQAADQNKPRLLTTILLSNCRSDHPRSNCQADSAFASDGKRLNFESGTILAALSLSR